MFMKYVTVDEMIAIEKEANSIGLSYDQMMENAGKSLADVILDEYSQYKEQGILGLVGSGNNGGDTLVALYHLLQAGWNAAAYIIRPRSLEDELTRRFVNAGGKVFDIKNDKNLQRLAELIKCNSVLLDGVLGTGIKLPLKTELADVFFYINKTISALDNKPIVIAVDCPSGVDCDSGAAAPECLPADLTITMAAVKGGLLKFPAYKLLGDLKLVGIGLPGDGKDLDTWNSINYFVPDGEWVKDELPTRPLDAHKGTFGTSLIIAGSINYTGAALLAGQAAYRIGSGLVTLAVPSSIQTPLAGQFPEATWLPLPEKNGAISADATECIIKNLEKPTALLIGPGFGLDSNTAQFLSALFSTKNSKERAESSNPRKGRFPPLVIDADGLKLLTEMTQWWKLIPSKSVLTPHPGEMSILTGLTIKDIQSDRLAIARAFSEKWEQIVVLKGAFTVVSSPDKRAAVIPLATPALARAGTGDVLAGIIVGLLSQGLDPFISAVAGAWIHAQAGLFAEKQLGNSASILAGDLLNSTVQVLTNITKELRK
jgi:NAD(P)H-hydrate epimerase